MTIKCCKDCVPPKRYPGCGSNCSEYQAEKDAKRKEREWLKEENKSTALFKNSFNDLSGGILMASSSDGLHRYSKNKGQNVSLC